MLIGDNRQAAKALNEAMAAQQANRTAPPMPQEVQYITDAHLFSHFDSRGGSTLLIGHHNTADAIRAYENAVGADPEWNMGYQDLKEGLGKVSIIVCGTPLPEEGELLNDYLGDGGYVAGILQSRYRYGNNTWSKWADSDVLVLFAPEEPDPEEEEMFNEDGTKLEMPAFMTKPHDDHGMNTEYRVLTAELGEDAFGLCLINTSK